MAQEIETPGEMQKRIQAEVKFALDRRQEYFELVYKLQLIDGEWRIRGGGLAEIEVLIRKSAAAAPWPWKTLFAEVGQGQ